MNPIQQYCQHVTRRHFLRDCGVGLGKIAFAGLLTEALSTGARAVSAPGRQQIVEAKADGAQRKTGRKRRRNAPVLAPSAARIESSPSRRMVRARIRLAMFEHAMTKTKTDAAIRTNNTVLAREVI